MVALIERLRAGDKLHQEAAHALAQFEPMAAFVLSDTKRGLEFIKWQRSRPSHGEKSSEE